MPKILSLTFLLDVKIFLQLTKKLSVFPSFSPSMSPFDYTPHIGQKYLIAFRQIWKKKVLHVVHIFSFLITTYLKIFIYGKSSYCTRYGVTCPSPQTFGENSAEWVGERKYCPVARKIHLKLYSLFIFKSLFLNFGIYEHIYHSNFD